QKIAAGRPEDDGGSAAVRLATAKRIYARRRRRSSAITPAPSPSSERQRLWLGHSYLGSGFHHLTRPQRGRGQPSTGGAGSSSSRANVGTDHPSEDRSRSYQLQPTARAD